MGHLEYFAGRTKWTCYDLATGNQKGIKSQGKGILL